MEIWGSKTPGTLWATPGPLRNCFTLLHRQHIPSIHFRVFPVVVFQMMVVFEFLQREACFVCSDVSETHTASIFRVT